MRKLASFKELKQLIDAAKAAKDEVDAFSKCSSIQNIPYELSQAFRDKYDPEHTLSPQQAFRKFYRGVVNIDETPLL